MEVAARADVFVGNLQHERMLEQIHEITVRKETRIGCAMDVITHSKHGAYSGASILREPLLASELRNGPKLLGAEILKASTRSEQLPSITSEPSEIRGPWIDGHCEERKGLQAELRSTELSVGWLIPEGPGECQLGDLASSMR